jgi:hypothetical protein
VLAVAEAEERIVRRLEWVTRSAFSAIAFVVFLIGFAVCDSAWQAAFTEIQQIPTAAAPNEIETLRAGIVSHARAVVVATGILMIFVLLLTNNVIVRVVLRRLQAGRC